MNSRRLWTGLLAGAIGLTIAATGCSGKKSVLNPKANERPTIELTRAPFNESTRFEYSYRMNWLGYDPDGRVAYYLYAIDPPSPTAANPEPDTVWTQTDKSERLISFSATKPDSSKANVNGSSDFHTFVVKAIDNGGLGGPLQSAPLVRSFFTYTIAPTVQILDPPPSDRTRAYVTPSVRINWTGTDEDGILDNKKPVKYKFILLTQNSPVPFQIALTEPDSVRRYYAPRNWAGWDSTTADTTTHQFTNLVVGQDYMFVVVAFDEAGAYSPVFSLNSNMLNMRITLAATGGPALTVFNEFFFFQYATGVYSLLPQYIIKIELPANEEVTFNWIGTPTPGAIVRGYRWALDIDDLSDQTQRTNERTDLKHWSQEGGELTSATVGPFGGGETHLFYIEAVDNNGLRSLATVSFFVVQSSLAKNLLVVDDTRYTIDSKRVSTSSCVDLPVSAARWPTAAELDTFLFARGGNQIKCYPTGTLSRPGLFAGYEFDTTGTRTGQSEVRVPLAKLGNYAHVVWICEAIGSNNTKNGTDIANSITALRYMSAAGRANSLAAYVKQGGEVWMVGGGCAQANIAPFNKPGNDTNPPAPGTTYSSIPLAGQPPELAPGRFMFDIVHWQSEIKIGLLALTTTTRFFGRYEGRPAPAEYRNLPAEMRFHSLALGDSIPPRPTSSGSFYYTNVDMEYLSQPNLITEDIDPSLLGFDEQSTLDTLYKVVGQTTVPANFNRQNVCMTRYVGPSYTHIIFTGFGIWQYSKVDCQAVVDAVLHDMWGMTKSAPPPPASMSRARTTAALAPAKTASVAAATPVSTARGGRLTSGSR